MERPLAQELLATNDNDGDVGADRRKAPRTWMRKKAAIRTRGGSLMHCMVKDLSRQGACLQIASTLGIAGDVELSFDNFHSMRVCRVVWRSTDQLGVAFVSGL
jgi:hypothetical protein